MNGPRPYRYGASASRIIAGAWCIVERGRIVRAARAYPTAATRIWVAGQGEIVRGLQPHPDRWPVHYAS